MVCQISVLLAATLVALGSPAVALPNSLPEWTNRYDYIIVGGGTSGLVVANRLSEDPAVLVAIIEAGGSVFDNVNVTSCHGRASGRPARDTSASGYGKAFGTAIDWVYKSTLQMFATNETQTLRAAKALGGTSTINGMTYMRAESGQVDAWQSLGNNITWDSLLPYYKRSEGFQTPTQEQRAMGADYDPSYHGFEGPLSVSWPNEMVGDNFSSILNATFDSINLPWNGDANSGQMRGFNIFPKTFDRFEDKREDAARAYYYPVSERPNLDVYLNATVQRITWETETRTSKPFASGVTYKTVNCTEVTILANREVILSAGSLRSPLLLELSGVGNKKILEEYGIDVKVDNPFVGENLNDQTTVDTTYAANQNITGAGGFIGYFNVDDVFSDAAANFSQSIKNALPAYVNKTIAANGGIPSMKALEKLFDIQHKLIFEDKAVISEVIVNAPSASSSVVEYWGLMPFSRGSVHIQSANASVPAMINPNFFALDYDVEQQVGTARMARKVATTASLSNILRSETLPSFELVPQGATVDRWSHWLKQVYCSNFHYIASAAMMSEDLGGVVDSNHLVYSTANVRVVDASVLPFQVSSHLTSTLYALAERVAEIIKDNH